MVRIENCIFDGCDADTNPAKGGAVYVGEREEYQGHPTQVTFDACLFSHNRAHEGGAFASQTRGVTTFLECAFVRNPADLGGGALLGHGIRVTFVGCTFYGNSFANLYCSTTIDPLSVTLQNTIVSFSADGEGIACWSSGGLHLELSCCDVYGNADGDWVGYIANQRGVDGNFWGDPGYCDTLNADFSIRASSPCMPDDLFGCGLIGAYGCGCPVDTLVVDPQGGGDYPTIQAALDHCAPWNIVEPVDGVYCGPGNRDILVPARAVTIRSESGNPSACLIDCQGSPLSPRRAFKFETDMGQPEIGQQSILRGIGVTGGDFSSEPGGGAIYCLCSSPRIAGCLLYRNDGGAAGGALFCEDSSPALVRCTLSGNEAMQGGGVYCSGSGRPALQASIVSFSSAGEAVYSLGTADPVLSCCCVYGNDGGDWVGCIASQSNQRCNFGVDPCFCGEGEDKYLLHADSPCVGGWCSCGVIGAMTSGCDSASCEWPTGSGVDLDAAAAEPRGLSLDVIPSAWAAGDELSFAVSGFSGSAIGELVLHDVQGRIVRSVMGGRLSAGIHAVRWDGNDQFNRTVPAGLYFCRLRAAGQTAVRSVLLIR